MDTIYKMGMITYIPNGEIPNGTETVRCKFAYKCKFGDKGQIVKKKARLVVRGDLQVESEYIKTFAPTSRFNTLRALMSVAVQERLKLVTFDIKGAFMVSPIDDKDIYIELPKGYEAPEGYTAKLSSSLYGCRDSAHRFWKTLSTWLIDYGFEVVNADKTLFRLKKDDGTIMFITLYVDDWLTAHNNDAEYAKFIAALASLFELSAESTEITWYLGVCVERDWEQGTLKLTQQQYVTDLLERFQMSDCNPVLTPMEVGQCLTSADCPNEVNKSNVKEYQQLVGSLNYLVAWTRGDLAFPVSQCSRFMANPGPSHIAAAKRILRYAKGTRHVGITFTADGHAPNQLYTYVDADHAGDPEGRRSVTGYCVMMNGSAISWESKRQKVTVLSSAESEFYAASSCGCEIMYLRQVLSAMGYEQDAPTPVAEDNVACIYMSKSSAMYNKGKHIDVRVYRLREFVQDSVMELFHISTAEQAADMFTKSLPSPALEKHQSVFSGGRV
eukprot:1241102-Rhodomonas_salina.1